MDTIKLRILRIYVLEVCFDVFTHFQDIDLQLLERCLHLIYPIFRRFIGVINSRSKFHDDHINYRINSNYFSYVKYIQELKKIKSETGYVIPLCKKKK